MRILLIVALFVASTAQAAFRCKDEKGVTHFGDTPPPGCANVMMYEISRSGMVLREIAPTLTTEQRKEKSEESARRKEEERAQAEQRRKDYALLATYGSEKDIDTSRELNLQPIQNRIASALARSAAVDKRLKELEAEKEFYSAGKGAKSSGKSRELPPQLKLDLERTQQELAALGKSVANYEKEMQEVRERYEADKARWVELKQLQRQGKLDLRPAR